MLHLLSRGMCALLQLPLLGLLGCPHGVHSSLVLMLPVLLMWALGVRKAQARYCALRPKTVHLRMRWACRSRGRRWALLLLPVLWLLLMVAHGRRC